MDTVLLSPTEDEFVGRISEELEHFLEQGQQHRVLLFPPLSSRLRYLIHRTVENMELLSSFSVGEGWRRRTVICHSAVRLPGDTRSDPKAGPNAPRGQRPAQPWGRGGRGLRPRQLGDSHGDNARGSVGSGRITRPPRRKPDKALFVARGSRKKANWREREPEGDGPENPVWNSQRERGTDGDCPENPIGNSERGMDGGGPKNLIGKSWRERGTEGDGPENLIGRSWRERGVDGGSPENPIGNSQREWKMDRDDPENPIGNSERGMDGDGPENPIRNSQRERGMDGDSPENPTGSSQREQGMDGDSPRGVPGKGGSDLGEGGAEHRPCRENAASFGNDGDSREREQREHRDRDWPRSRPADGDGRDPSRVPENSVPSEKHGGGRTERGGAELETQNTTAPSLESSGNAEGTRRFSMREIHEWENPETSEERLEWSQERFGISQERFGTGQERFGTGQEEPKPPQNLKEGADEAVATPDEAVATPELLRGGDPTTPKGDPEALKADPTTLKDDPMTLRGDRTTPEGDPVAPTSDPTTPMGHPTAPEGDPTTLKDDPTAPRGHPEAPIGDPTVPEGHPTVPEGHPTVPEGHPTSSRGHPMVIPHPKAPPEQQQPRRERSDAFGVPWRGNDPDSAAEGPGQDGIEDECPAELLAEILGKLTVKEISIERISVDCPGPNEAPLSEADLGHVTEIYDFPPTLKTEDLMEMFLDFHESGFKLQWVDGTHALGIFSSLSTASQALGRRYPSLKIRPLIHASKQSKIKALQRPKLLQLGKERPQTDAAVARRLVSHALGWRQRPHDPPFLPEPSDQDQ